jgi:hypothetical protein
MIELKLRHFYLAFGVVMLVLFADSTLQIASRPVSTEMELITAAFGVIGLILYLIELHAEQTREAIQAIQEEVES